MVVRTEEGESLDPAIILPKLTGNATPDLFRNVFAFSLDELQNEGLMNDAGVANRIYGAGLEVSRLHDLSEALNKGKRGIFLPTGQQQKVAESLRELERIDAQLRVIEGNAGLYGALTARKSEIASELQEAEGELTLLGSQQAEIGRLLEGWEDWIALTDCDSQLRDMLAFADFPDNPFARLDGLEERERQAREGRDEAAGHLRQSEEAAATVIPGEDLLYDRGRIETILRARGSFDDSLKDLPDRRAELNAVESELGDLLRDLGQGWDEDRLADFRHVHAVSTGSGNRKGESGPGAGRSSPLPAAPGTGAANP